MRFVPVGNTKLNTIQILLNADPSGPLNFQTDAKIYVAVITVLYMQNVNCNYFRWPFPRKAHHFFDR